MNKEEFVKRSEETHGNIYDYSMSVYENCDSKVCIKCLLHGYFWQTPYNHYRMKQGCPICAELKKKKLKLGFGINDMDIPSFDKGYRNWCGMITRCYSIYYLDKFPTYVGCCVCDEWKYFSNFKAWFDENYIEGYVLDKDILVKGNKVYSPETCSFVPQEINALLNNKVRNKNGKLIGVSYRYNKYIARMYQWDKAVHLGYFDTEKEAFMAYKQAKESYIKEVANKWKDNIAQNIYEALMRYEIEITD